MIEKNALTDLLPDMDSGQLPGELDAAVRKVALAVAMHDNTQIKGEVTLKLKFSQVKGSGQLAIEHSLSHVSPLTRGKEGKTTDGDTVVFIDTGSTNRGALSVLPPNQLKMEFGQIS